MKLKETHLLWAAWLMIVIGVLAENTRLRQDIERLETYQHEVNVMIYENVHKLTNKTDSLWIYETTDKSCALGKLD